MRRINTFRRRQRELLRESNHPRHPHTGEGVTHGGHRTSPGPEQQKADMRTGDPVTSAAVVTPPDRAPEHAATAEGPIPYGIAGLPFDRSSPFYFGFLATLGGLIAWTLFNLFGQLTTTLTILIVAFFLTLALDPLVGYLTGRGMHRALSVLAVFSGVLVIIGVLIALVVPPVVREGSDLLSQAPDYLGRLLETKWLQDLDQHYEVVQKAQEELTKRIQDGSLVGQVFGGVLGAGRLVVNGVFQIVTILILTLYFLATLPRIKKAAYAAVPASRRPRIVSLSEEIMRRTGAYAAGQTLVATINALCSFIMMSIIGVPYPAVLAVLVGLLGLIPMVGATLGAVLVGLVAFFDEPQKALIVGIYYVVYQQVENYVVVPRIMQSTVSVPGAVTIVAALAGGTLLGVLGALLAIPVAAGLLLLYEEVLLPRQASH